MWLYVHHYNSKNQSKLLSNTFPKYGVPDRQNLMKYNILNPLKFEGLVRFKYFYDTQTAKNVVTILSPHLRKCKYKYTTLA